MKTTHVIYFEDSRNMEKIPSDSIDLVVTSPPYPMIEMWDDLLFALNPDTKKAMASNQTSLAFDLMHNELDSVWDEVYRILKNGAIACINIGDATRTIQGDFALYTNHSRIESHMRKIGFSSLPAIIWRKQTNAPNKFMGSGMMPPGAYVTLEHEYILIFRKGSKMDFKSEEAKRGRRESAFFWEERNFWYSDVWMDLKGASQNLTDHKIRIRSAAFPFELPYRLINMFSVKGGQVLDPFMGTGTTTLAAMASGRNSIGFELDPNFQDTIIKETNISVPFGNSQIRLRLENHERFVQGRLNAGYKFKHKNKWYGFPVMTSQETDLLLNRLNSLTAGKGNTFEVTYADEPQKEFCKAWKDCFITDTEKPSVSKERFKKATETEESQLSLIK